MNEPLISLVLGDRRKAFQPGDVLEYEYQIDAVDLADIQAVEDSVLWYTEGKGDPDLAVHHFRRRVPADAEDGDLRRLCTHSSRLPKSPLSYAGINVRICWCVRVKVFMRRGRVSSFEQPFQLGSIPPAQLIADPDGAPAAASGN